MIVFDASAALAALLNAGASRRTLGLDQVHVPHLIDAEVASGLRRRVRTGQLGENAGWRALNIWRRLGMTRYPVLPLLERMWQLRENVSAYDAAYVALAEHLDCALLTADKRLARAPMIRCPVTVIPR